MNVTKNQAICMFFYVDYTDENVTNYKKKIDEFEDVEICYNVDERQPILVSKQRIRGDPITYRKYLESIDSSLDQAQSNKRQRNELRKLKIITLYTMKITFACRNRSTNCTIY